MARCFPESLQLPALGTPELQALRDDLARKIANGSSRRGAQKTIGASADLKLTTNRAVTYASSGSARTDLFFKYKGSDPLATSSSDQINQLLQQVLLTAAAAAFLLWQHEQGCALCVLTALALTSGMAGRSPRHPEAHSPSART
jgi:hypothetical protein